MKYIIISIALLAIVSCKKQERLEKKWFTSIVFTSSEDYSEAGIVVDYDFSGSSSGREHGIFYGKNADITYDNGIVMQDYSSSARKKSTVFNLEDLTGQTTYYVRSYIKGDTKMILSEVKSFNTADLPQLDCSYDVSEIDFGFGVVNFNDLELEQTGDYWYLKSDGGPDNGKISIRFVKKPTTNVYKTSSSQFSSDEEYVYIVGQMPLPYNCTFYAKGSNSIQVVENPDGTYKVECCEVSLKLTAPTGGCPGNYEMSGYLEG